MLPSGVRNGRSVKDFQTSQGTPAAESTAPTNRSARWLGPISGTPLATCCRVTGIPHYHRVAKFNFD